MTLKSEVYIDPKKPQCVQHCFSSRMCEHGTKSCITKHGTSNDTPDGEHRYSLGAIMGYLRRMFGKNHPQKLERNDKMFKVRHWVRRIVTLESGHPPEVGVYYVDVEDFTVHVSIREETQHAVVLKGLHEVFRFDTSRITNRWTHYEVKYDASYLDELVALIERNPK